MAKKDLSLHPQSVTDSDWYYEENAGIVLQHEVRDATTGQYLRTDQIKIPWKKIKRTMERYNK